ncbi:hypothetical protein HUU05_22630 [candidate division KSB1 bacterium]|nr:hypothetical protein [candidate division KSB1 bacterium]
MKCRNSLWIAAIVSLSLASLGGNVAAFAQADGREANKNFYWVNLGVGGSSFGGAYGLGVCGQFGWHLFSLRCTGAHNVETSQVGSEFSMHYGLGKRNRSAAFSLAVGAGVVQGNRHHGLYLYDFDPVWGFSTEAQLFGRVANNVGVGLSALLNQNKEKDFLVFLLCVQFGKLWP